jgi:glucokinase
MTEPIDAGPMALVADIGGTNARMACWWPTRGRIEQVQTLAVAQHADVVAATKAYLAAVAAAMGVSALVPAHIGLAVAVPLDGDRVTLTNGPWSFSRSAVARALGVASLVLLNDFEALALSLPRLRADQIQAWPGTPAIDPHGGHRMLAVVGPGTGLGVAGCVRTDSGWQALPAEGGHASFAPADDFEVQVLRAAWLAHPHVSAERLISGVGLPVLHGAVAQVMGRPNAASLTTEAIVARGMNGDDAVSSATLDAFCSMLGSFAGSVTLTLGARGGLFVGGGIVPRLGERFFSSRFRERFEAKGRYQPYLQQVGTALITDTLAGLSGVAAAVEQRWGASA